jgi:hypothetical protein
VSRPLALATACFLLVTFASAAPLPKGKEAGPEFIELKAHINHKMKDDFHNDRFPGNNLSSLPTGKQTFAGVKFHIGDGVVQLGSTNVAKKPEKVEGIKVGRTLARLHILHATGFNAEDDTVIAKYVVHYADKTKAEIEVAYGKDVVDWWAYPDRKAPTRSKVAWEGENEPVKEFKAKLKLYLTTWKNPHPKKKVVSLDFVGTDKRGIAAPFCVALTADDKAEDKAENKAENKDKDK